MKKTILALGTIIAMVAAVVASYFSPQFTLYQLNTYAEKGDTRELGQYVDSTALRENIRLQLAGAAGSASGKTADHTEAAAWSASLLQTTINRLVEGYVSTAGIKVILAHQNPLDQITPSAPVETKSFYRNWNTFAVEYRRNGKPDGAVILARRGLFSWRLSGTELPDWLASPEIASDQKKAEEAAHREPGAKTTLGSTGWEYTDLPDEMRGTTTRVASIKAVSTLDFDFPYQGGSVAGIVLRDRPGERPIVFLFVKPGQFSCSGDHCNTVVKFDDAPTKKFVMLHTDDGDPAVLWFYDSRSFIEQLKGAKHVVIEADFYQAGPRQMKFDVAGLKWEKRQK